MCYRVKNTVYCREEWGKNHPSSIHVVCIELLSLKENTPPDRTVTLYAVGRMRICLKCTEFKIKWNSGHVKRGGQVV